MKQQFENSRETLIGNLESKLSLLKQQRDQYLNRRAKEENQEQSEKVNISDYLKNQGLNLHKQEIKAQIIPKKYSIEKAKKFQPKSKIEILHQKEQTKQKCKQLEQLYKRKRQLESIGISENDPMKITNLYKKDQTRKKIQRERIHQKKQLEIKKQKQKIISQELTKAKQFLKEGKAKNKLRNVQNQYSYKMLLSKQQNILNEYESLLYNKKLTLLQQQRLIDISFNLLKQFNGKAKRSLIKEYLQANPQFCNRFYISKIEIMRDLEVYQTKQREYLNFTEFYEFVKSIEITNKGLHPKNNYDMQDKFGKNNKINSKQQILNSKSNDSRQMEEYLKKVFVYLDQNKQKLVQRQRIQIAIKKGLLFDIKNYKTLSKQAVLQFGQQIAKTRQKIKPLQYYKTLDMKYIGLDQLVDLYQKYKEITSKANDNQQQQLHQHGQAQQNEDNIYPQQEIKQQQEENQNNKIDDDLNDFQKYGWGEHASESQKFAQLKQVDQYYHQISDKYGNEIHWNGFEHYRQNFDKFNECIKQLSRQKEKGQSPYLNSDFQNDQA